MARGRKTGGRDFAPGNPGGGRPPGAPNLVTPSIKAIFRELAQEERARLKQTLRTLLLRPRTCLEVLRLMTPYLDGRPPEEGDERRLQPITIVVGGQAIRPQRSGGVAIEVPDGPPAAVPVAPAAPRRAGPPAPGPRPRPQP